MNIKKMGIQKRILFLLLATGLATFLVISAVSLVSLYQSRSDSLETGRTMGETVASFTEDFAARQAKKRLSDEAEDKAETVEHIVKGILQDADNLARSMTGIMSEKENYPARVLTTPTEEKIPGNIAYVYKTTGFAERLPYDPLLQKELGTAANIAEILEFISREYQTDTSCYVASENGYMIWADGLSKGDTHAELPDVYLKREFNALVRPWYIAAKEKGKPVVTDVYVSVEGDLEVTCAAPYYDSGEFAGVAGISTPLDSLYALVQEKNMGKDSINFALNRKGCVVLSTQKTGTLAVSADTDLRLSGEQSLAMEAASMAAGKRDVALVTVDGEEYYLAYAPMPSIGWSFGTLVKRDAVVGPAKEIRHTVMSESKKFAAVLDDFFFGNFIRMAVLMLFILAVLVYISRRAARRFVEPVLALSAGVKDIAKGNLDRKLDIKTGDEIEGLADSVNEMTDDLKKYMDNLATATADKERIATELSLAQGIQEGMLPQIFPKFSNNPHFDLFASMEPAREVGGDFYDFYSLDDDHLALTIADVSGKGVPASLFMVISKTILKNAALSMGQAADLGHMMEISNRQLCENNEEMMFVTVFFGVLDVKTGEFSYVNAGHNAPYIGRTEDGHTEWSSLSDEKKNYMVGAVENAVYDERKITLKPGDMLFVYTDGVTEAMNENGELYTDERLEATLGRVATPDKNSETILAEVRADVAEHVGEAESSDDVTMLGIRYLGA